MMLRRICTVCWRSRTVFRSQQAQKPQLGLLYSSYQSHYSLNRLYPGRDPDPTKPLEKPAEEVCQRLTDRETEKRADVETFSGYIPIDKIKVSFSKSGGPGGQNVNKVESKVEMRFHLDSADWLPASIREQIFEKKKTKVNAKGELVVTSQKTRSQMRNVQDCLLKLREIIAEVQRKPKEPDETSAAVWRMRQEKATRDRLRQKTLHSKTKRDRQVYSDE